jgi:hypothetical protein
METGDTYNLNPSTPRETSLMVWLYFFRIVKEQTALALK